MAVRLRKWNVLVVAAAITLILIILVSMRSSLKLSRYTKDKDLSTTTRKSQSALEGGPVLELPKPVGNVSRVRLYTLEGMIENAAIGNYYQVVKNKEKFGSHGPEDPVIVVQTHDRDNFLKLLLESLKKVKGIETATLIISRDMYTPEMDRVIDAIDFCRWIEIFFPFSKQLHPHTFPGEDPNDCPRDLSKSEARARKCNNAECPDMYGHYREVKFVQLKHHWFWKLNMIFNGIKEIHQNSGPIIFLEDDNYVAPDLIDVMRKMTDLRDVSCPDCLSLTLGAYDPAAFLDRLSSSAEIKPWVSSEHNIGMVLHKEFYDKFTVCSEYFCKYDDYNWDWSLQATALRCMSPHLYTVIAKVPRVFHLGCTGFHQKQGGKCDVDAEVNKLQSTFSSNMGLFPDKMEIISTSKTPNPSHVQNGGWGDLRDHALCQKYMNLTKVFLK